MALWLGLLAASAAGFLLLAWLMPAERGEVDWTNAAWLFGVLAVVTGGLARVRRFNLAGTVKIVAGWSAIFLLLVAGYALRDEAPRLALKVRAALLPGYAIEAAPHSLVVGRGEDSAFYVVGKVNGAPVRFNIDTGSTDILLSPADAERAGLRPQALSYSRPSATANGVGYGASATVDNLVVGSIHMTGVPVTINKAPMGASLLGMPFLRRLDSFEVRGDQMFLRGRN